MVVLEIGKGYLRKEYNNNIKQALLNRDYLVWDKDRIKHAFNFGNGTEKDLKRYVKDNRQYCIFIILPKANSLM